jgi:hypothetical protein
LKKKARSLKSPASEVAMKLEECRDRMINLAAVARIMEYSPPYVYDVVNGKVNAGKRFLRDLEKVNIEDVIKHAHRRKLKNS